MHSERAQGTVEYVGMLLVVGVLLGALVAAFGLPASSTSLAGVFTRALGSAFGLAPAPVATRPPVDSADRALFARAVDAGVPVDDRPSLRDVRLALIAAHGDEGGRAAFRTLVLDDLRAVVPGLASTTRFGTLDGPALVIGTDTDRAIARARALAQPAHGDEGELETPIGRPNAHVVTADEQDRAFASALHPGVSWKALAVDGISALPVVGTVMGVKRVAVAGARIAAGIATVISDYGDADEVVTRLSPSARSIPPGALAGDEIVTWTASRRPVSGGPVRTVERSAIVRDGVVLTAGLELDR